MPLQKIQSKFAIEAAKLILVAESMGYEVTFGDAYRDPRCPYGSEKSRHHERLAIDLNLFKDGVYLRETEHHLLLGQYWESIGGEWGGRWSDNDGNHYQWPER